MKIDSKKLIKDLNVLIDENYKIIEDDMDGDNECAHEVQTLENVIYMIEQQIEGSK